MTGAPIKVLFVVGVLTGGGAERFVSTTLRYLDRARFVPSLVLFRNEISYALPDDVVVTILSKDRKRDILRAIWQLKYIICEQRPDVIFTAHAGISPFAAEALRLSAHQPIWITRVSFDPATEDRGLHGRWVRRAYKRADHFVANSRQLGEAVIRTHPVAAERTDVIYNPTDFDDIERSSKARLSLELPAPPIVITMGRLDSQKRHDLLLEAFTMVVKAVDARLVILGEGPLRDRIEARVQSLELQDRVSLAGFQANPFPILARSDLFVLSSDYEGLPNALIEAQGLGLAAVSTDCSYGPSEIIDPGKTGLLVPTGDVDKLAAAIVELLEAPNTRRAMGAAARQRVRRKFSVSAVLSDLEALIELCIERVDS